MLKFNLMKSWTVWGAVGSALTWLSQQPKVGLVEIAQATFGLVLVIGGRNAVEKNGPIRQ